MEIVTLLPCNSVGSLADNQHTDGSQEFFRSKDIYEVSEEAEESSVYIHCISRNPY